MTTPLITPDLTWLFRAENNTVQSVIGSATDKAVAIADLDCAGEAWLDGITQGLELTGTFSADGSQTAATAILVGDYAGFIPGAGETYVCVFEFDSPDNDLGALEQFVPKFEMRTSLNQSGQYTHLNIFNTNKKNPVMFATYVADSAAMREPNHWINNVTEEDPWDWDSAPEDKAFFWLVSTAGNPPVTGLKCRFIGVAAMATHVPQVLVTLDDGHKTVYTEFYPHAVTHDVPFHVFLNGNSMEGAAGHDSDIHLSNADLNTMRDYRRPNGERLVTFGNHGYTHESLHGDRDTDITFATTGTITSAGGNLSRMLVGSNYVIRAPGDPNDGNTVTFSTVSPTLCTTNEVIDDTNSAGRSDGVWNWIDRDDDEREAQILDNEALLAPYWQGQWKTFANPYGRSSNHSAAVLAANNYKLVRDTTVGQQGNDYGAFLNHTGLPRELTDIKVLGGLGETNFDTQILIDQRMDIAEQTGGLVVIVGHKFEDGTGGSTDFNEALVNAMLTDWRARDDAGTINLISMNDVTESVYGPAPVNLQFPRVTERITGDLISTLFQEG